jgi:PAS domain S-box-containing protein
MSLLSAFVGAPEGVEGELQGAEAVVATATAGPRQRRIAIAAIILSAAAFAACVPYARMKLTPVPAFIPAYEAQLLLIDLITAIMLVGQYVQLRSAALLALGAGYLFDALMVISHALSFPGLIAPAGWLGSGGETTAWLYMFWHGGFAIFVMAYAGLRRGADGDAATALPRYAVGFVVAAVIGLVTGLTLLSASRSLLPAIMAGNGYTPALKFVVGAVWGLSLLALLVLVRRRAYSLLDLWLIVVMVAWLFDIALSAVLNAGRFDLGFYAGRLFGLAAASFVLAVMLVETGALQAKLAMATAQLRDQARELERRVRERTREVVRVNGRLQAFLEASPLAIVMLDPAGVVALWNPAAERTFGYTAAEAIGRLPPYLADAHMADFQARIARAADDAAVSGFYETQRTRKDGAVVDLGVHWARINEGSGEMPGVVAVIADTTERKKLESHLRQAQKMEAVGNLAGGMAHDFNNHLGVIILNLDVLKDRLADGAEDAELADEALNAALRGAELIRRLLAFARRQPLQPQRTDINRLIAEIAKLLDRTLGETIKITLDLDPDLWPAVIDPAQLESSLTNLATNARDAMPNGGELTVASGNRYLDEDYAATHTEVTPGDYAMVEVSDSGDGIPPELLSQVFEPFFTTKAAGSGTGLGLSMVYGFIKQSGGHINIYSEVGIGTTVRLYLPRGDAREAAAAAAPPAVGRGRGETVLAVEDNPGLRRVVVRQLSELGYRVIEAADAGAALAILEEQPVALLFSDVVLPGGITGYELARLAKARWPGVKIVLTSGFPENRMGDEIAGENIKLLGKPYRRQDIARVIGEILGETGSG